jgi:hypothetical protein
MVINQTAGVPGYIQYYLQAYTGPNVLNSRGYVPIVFHPGTPGDYSLEFNPVYLEKIDVTVIDTLVVPKVAIDGRLWSQDWCISTSNLSPQGAFNATQYILSDDSIVTSIYYNGMLGHHFDVTSTSNGCYPPPMPWDSSCRSRPSNHHYAQYKIFLNDPDSIEFPTGSLGTILPGTTSVTTPCDGSLVVNFNVNKPGLVKMNIEVNPAPGMQPEDVAIIDSATSGINSFVWLGNNGLGNRVQNGVMVGVTLSYINGLTNLALYDIEKHLSGFVISLVRPSGNSLSTYWNDTLLANKGGVSQLAGCFSSLPSTGCHSWDGFYNGIGLGSENTVNTWWYASSSSTSLGLFEVKRVPSDPQGVSGPGSLCNNATGVYGVIPQPLTGADLQGYEWVLTDAASGLILFDSAGRGPQITIPFASFPPGDKRLKVRASNTNCGYSAYGPGTNGEGILISVLESPSILNSSTSFSICTGSNINILFQLSVNPSMIEYFSSATSLMVTGFSGGTNNPLNQTIFNTGTETDSVIYKVIPTYLTCTGDTTNFYVKVSPVANITNTITTFNLCSGETTSIGLTSNFTGADFTWTAAASSPAIGGYSNASGTQIAQPLTNSGTSSGTVTYTVSADMGGCLGPSKDFIVTVNPGSPVTVFISTLTNSVCAGSFVTFTATPTNGGVTPGYQWQVNGITTGANSPAYAYTPTDGDVVTCILLSNAGCPVNNPATSNAIIMNVLPIMSVSNTIIASSNPFCAASSVTFTALPVNGGTSPGYQWKVNGINAGTNSPGFIYSPANGDVVTCSLLSSETCTSGNPAQSNPVIMVVNATLPADVTVTASANPFCAGSAVTFTATPVNGGTSPGYQWKVNAINAINANNASYAYNALNGDVVTCEMASNLSCVIGNPATSSPIAMIERASPNVNFTACFDTITTVNAKPIKLKGGVPPGGQYSGPGVNSVTGVFNPSEVGTGLKTISYAYTNVYTCSTATTRTILVQPSPAFMCGNNLIDIRDNKAYATVLTGTQCWMKENLDFGFRISDLVSQTDNCTAEKYQPLPPGPLPQTGQGEA